MMIVSAIITLENFLKKNLKKHNKNFVHIGNTNCTSNDPNNADLHESTRTEIRDFHHAMTSLWLLYAVIGNPRNPDPTEAVADLATMKVFQALLPFADSAYSGKVGVLTKMGMGIGSRITSLMRYQAVRWIVVVNGFPYVQAWVRAVPVIDWFSGVLFKGQRGGNRTRYKDKLTALTGEKLSLCKYGWETKIDYYVSISKREKAVIVALRGTEDASDILVDMDCQQITVALWGGKHRVHRGIWRSAKHLAGNASLKKMVGEALEDNPSFKLVICGHSLGGGLAALLTMIWKDENGSESFMANKPNEPSIVSLGKGFMADMFPNVIVTCYTFGPAASMDIGLSTKSKYLIQTLINKNDMIPTLCYGTVTDLRDLARYFRTVGWIDQAEMIWPWSKRARNNCLANVKELEKSPKLVPPGTVWVVHPTNSMAYKVDDVDMRYAKGGLQMLPGMLIQHMLGDYKASLDHMVGGGVGWGEYNVADFAFLAVRMVFGVFSKERGGKSAGVAKEMKRRMEQK